MPMRNEERETPTKMAGFFDKGTPPAVAISITADDQDAISIVLTFGASY